MPLKVGETIKVIEADGWYLAAAFHLEGLGEDGEPVPVPAAVGAETIIEA